MALISIKLHLMREEGWRKVSV